MTNQEAYNLGRQVGELVKMGIRPMVSEIPLPKGILPYSPQSFAYQLGYQDELRNRLTIIKE